MKAIDIQLQSHDGGAPGLLQVRDEDFVASLVSQLSHSHTQRDEILASLDNPDARAALFARRVLEKVSRGTIVRNAVRHLQGLVAPHETISSAELGAMARKSTLMAMASEMCREAESQQMHASAEARFGELHRVRMSSVHLSTTAVSNFQMNFDFGTDVEVELEVIAVVGFVIVAVAILDAAPENTLIQSRDIMAAASRYLAGTQESGDVPLEQMMPVCATDVRILAKRILSNYQGESAQSGAIAREEAA